MVQGENGLLVELRCNNSFSEQIFADIKNYLNEHLSEWKASGFIPIADAVSIFNLIDELSGGSRFWSEEVELRAKVFENGDPYLDLLDVLPKEAKRDKRLHNSGSLRAFRYQNEDFPLIPKTVFYDFIYIAAVKKSFAAGEINAISNYNYFTDIEFNPAKSINTQARAAAMIKLILDQYGELPDFSKEQFIQYHKEHIVY